MRNVTISFFALAALMTLAAPASAQETMMGAGVRVGLFYPVDGTTKAITGKQWTSFGLDYRIKGLGHNNDGSDESLAVSLDFFQKGSFRNTPVLLNYVSESGQMYYFLGAGVGFTKQRNDENEDENRILPAYQFGLGYKFNSSQMPVFFELKWVGSTEQRFNGWGIFAGVRF